MKIVTVLFYLLISLFLLTVFAPKTSIYYSVEEGLKRQKIIFSNEEILEHMFGLTLGNGELYIEEVLSAKIEKVELSALFFINSIEASGVVLDESFEGIFPAHIDSIKVNCSIISPLKCPIKATGDFGEVRGNILIKERRVELSITPSKLLSERYSSIMRLMKKDEQGGYAYELSL